MVQQQLPSANSHFSPKLKRAVITQTNWGSGPLHQVQPLEDAVRSNSATLPQSPVKETRGGVSGRPQLPSGAVCACNLTGGSIGPTLSSPWPPSSVCRGSGQQFW